MKIERVRQFDDNLANCMVSSYYKRHLGFLWWLLFITRFSFFKRSPLVLEIVQKYLINYLRPLQDVISEGNRILKSPPLGFSEKDRKNYERTRFCNQQIERISKTIMDGVLWRNLQYDRPIINYLSDNHRPGHFTADSGTIKAVQGGNGIFSKKYVTILSDLTRSHRTGDFVKIYKSGEVIFFESKQNGKRISTVSEILDKIKQGGAISKQDDRLFSAQMGIINRKIRITSLLDKPKIIKEINIRDLDYVIETHNKTVRTLIKKARKSGYACLELEDGLFAKCFSFSPLMDSEDLRKKYELQLSKQDNIPEWVKSGKNDILHVDTYISFYEVGSDYARLMTPASILDLPTSDCMDLMSGFLRIKLYLSIPKLKKYFSENGWSFSLIDDTTPTQEIEYGGNIYKYIIEKNDERGVYQIKLSNGDLLMMLSSFYRRSFILQMCNSLYEYRTKHITTYEGRYHMIRYIGEITALN